MQWRILVFVAFQVAATIYVLRRGGAPERVAVLLMAMATIATAALPTRPAESFRTMELGEVTVDLLLFAGLVGVAARADRYWPLWVAALQLLVIAVHGVRAYDPTLLPIVYARVVGEAAYPIILLLLIGTRRHRLRLAAGTPEKDWSPLVWR